MNTQLDWYAMDSACTDDPLEWFPMDSDLTDEIEVGTRVVNALITANGPY